MWESDVKDLLKLHRDDSVDQHPGELSNPVPAPDDAVTFVLLTL